MASRPAPAAGQAEAVGKVPSLRFQGLRPRSKVQGPKSKVQSPRSKVQGPRSKVQGPKSKVQSPRSKVQGPKSKVQSPRSQAENIRAKATALTAKSAKNAKKARLGLSGRDLLPFFALFASFAVPIFYSLVVRRPLPERKSRQLTSTYVFPSAKPPLLGPKLSTKCPLRKRQGRSAEEMLKWVSANWALFWQNREPSGTQRGGKGGAKGGQNGGCYKSTVT
jgi:hypothetical protein